MTKIQKINIKITHDENKDEISFIIDCEPSIERQEVEQGNYVQGIATFMLHEILETIKKVKEMGHDQD